MHGLYQDYKIPKCQLGLPFALPHSKSLHFLGSSYIVANKIPKYVFQNLNSTLRLCVSLLLTQTSEDSSLLFTICEMPLVARAQTFLRRKKKKKRLTGLDLES